MLLLLLCFTILNDNTLEKAKGSFSLIYQETKSSFIRAFQPIWTLVKKFLHFIHIVMLKIKKFIFRTCKMTFKTISITTINWWQLVVQKCYGYIESFSERKDHDSL